MHAWVNLFLQVSIQLLLHLCRYTNGNTKGIYRNIHATEQVKVIYFICVTEIIIYIFCPFFSERF